MAYTSSALSYLIQNSPKPIIITGAQKPISMEVTDAKTNLLDSLRFAACPDAHGVCIVFNGKVIAGTRAKKVHSKSFNAFDSINFRRWPPSATIRLCTTSRRAAHSEIARCLLHRHQPQGLPD